MTEIILRNLHASSHLSLTTSPRADMIKYYYYYSFRTVYKSGNFIIFSHTINCLIKKFREQTIKNILNDILGYFLII